MRTFGIGKLLSVLLIAGALFSACGKLDNEVEAAQAEVTEFRRLVREGEFGRIHEQSSKAFRDSATLSQLEGFLSPLQKTIADDPRSLVGWKAGVDRTHGYILTLTFRATVENRLPNEEFIFVKEGGRIRLVNYRIW